MYQTHSIFLLTIILCLCQRMVYLLLVECLKTSSNSLIILKVKKCQCNNHGVVEVQVLQVNIQYTQTSIQWTSPSDPFSSLYGIIQYIKCNMFSKFSKWELGLVRFISLYYKVHYIEVRYIEFWVYLTNVFIMRLLKTFVTYFLTGNHHQGGYRWSCSILPWKTKGCCFDRRWTFAIVLPCCLWT